MRPVRIVTIRRARVIDCREASGGGEESYLEFISLILAKQIFFLTRHLYDYFYQLLTRSVISFQFINYRIGGGGRYFFLILEEKQLFKLKLKLVEI